MSSAEREDPRLAENHGGELPAQRVARTWVVLGGAALALAWALSLLAVLAGFEAVGNVVGVLVLVVGVRWWIAYRPRIKASVGSRRAVVAQGLKLFGNDVRQSFRNDRLADPSTPMRIDGATGHHIDQPHRPQAVGFLGRSAVVRAVKVIAWIIACVTYLPIRDAVRERRWAAGAVDVRTP